jgi:hypothetical protein
MECRAHLVWAHIEVAVGGAGGQGDPNAAISAKGGRGGDGEGLLVDMEAVCDQFGGNCQPHPVPHGGVASGAAGSGSSGTVTYAGNPGNSPYPGYVLIIW